MTHKNKENELNGKKQTAKPKLKQPSGWKRTHELKSEELGVTHIEAEWTNKESVKCVITRYTNTEGKRKYTFKILKIADGKQTGGKNTFNNVRDALAEIYGTFMS